jgi:hypothetical protein
MSHEGVRGVEGRCREEDAGREMKGGTAGVQGERGGGRVGERGRVDPVTAGEGGGEQEERW